MFTATVLFFALTGLAAAKPGYESTRLASYYFNGGACNGAGDMTGATPACSIGAKKMGDYANWQQIVAIDSNLVQNHPDWCGREVELYVNGQKFTINGLPFILYDGCGECNNGDRVDVGGQAHTGLAEIAGGKTCELTDKVITVKVLDRDVTHILEGGSANKTWAMWNFDERMPHLEGQYPPEILGAPEITGGEKHEVPPPNEPKDNKDDKGEKNKDKKNTGGK